MKVRHGPRGKYFTDVIRKLPVRAKIWTVGGVIIGTIHVHPDHRTLDELNESEGFIGVTDAVVHPGEEAEEAGFVAVNKANILWITPLEEQIHERD